MKKQFYVLTLCLPVLISCGQSGFTLKPVAPGQTEQQKAGLPPGLATGEQQMKLVCGRTGNDPVRKAFCATNRPRVRSLSELQNVLGLDFSQSSKPKFALLASTASLLTKFVSSANPVAFVFSDVKPDFVAVSFARGEPFVEMAVGDPDTNEKHFYLGHFGQDCDLTNSCGPADRITPAIERNWQSFTLYEDTDLKNTILDCLHCHAGSVRPGTNGKGSGSDGKALRMQELVRPWTHWMQQQSRDGQDLLAEFHSVHGSDESYGGIPANLLDQSNPAALEAFVRLLGDGGQPNTFDSEVINSELGQPSVGFSPLSAEFAPLANRVNSQSWLQIFSQFSAGFAIAVPYYKNSVADAAKLSKMASAYQAVKNGSQSASQMPDIRNVFPDDAVELAAMGHQVLAGLPANQMLTNACADCHNQNLDQSLSQSHFRADLVGISTAELSEAARRISLPENDPQHMPPARFRSLTAAQISTLSQYLKSSQATSSPTLSPQSLNPFLGGTK